MPGKDWRSAFGVMVRPDARGIRRALRVPTLLLLAFVATPLFAKSLHWQAVDVAARLDGDGRMHVVERQTIVFDGNWNGAERIFNIRTGQSFDFESMAHLVDGVERPLVGGDTFAVDHYDFTGPYNLRWRSRLSSDPEFKNNAITYVLRYTISGVLREAGGTYTLSHDFAFPDHQAVIRHFSLRLDLDPDWRGARSPIILSRDNLQHGDSVIVTLMLTYSGARSPATAIHILPSKTLGAIFVLFLIFLVLLGLDFYLAEDGNGRFARLLRPSEIDEAWLSEHLLTIPPEVAGAAVDERVGAPEVAAVLARMTHEGKIASTLEERGGLRKRKVLCLKLLADRASLRGYEQKLVEGLFFDDRKETDTDLVRKEYAVMGFNPGALVEKGLKNDLAALPEWNKNPRRANWMLDTAYLAGALVLMIVAGQNGGNDIGVIFLVAIGGLVLLVCATAAANSSARAIDNLSPRLALPLLVLAPLLWVVGSYILKAGRYTLHLPTLIGISAWALAVTKMTFDALRIRETPLKIDFRKRLAAARRYFLAELRSPRPRLRDEWYPYCLAFGIGKNVERWFGAHGEATGAGAASSINTTSSSFSSSSSSSSDSGWSWSGGGGSFGGAGATGGWADAAGALASGVSVPSSSGGSGGSSSGGSSSGGGGGGGW